MPVLHFDLEPKQGNRLELHAFWDNPADYRSRLVDTEEIRQVIAAIRQPYYDARRDLRPEDYRPLGKALYDWVNGEERWLDGAIAQHSGERLILAIAVELAHLPWEILHDGTQFLLERRIVPVR